MDNITHSLFGATVSESFWAFLPERTKAASAPHTRRALLFTSVLANNFPDLDVLYSSRFYPNTRISSLLHHRGHTHTFLIALLESLLILGVLAFIQYGLKKWSFQKEWRLLSVTAFLGVLTHIFLDSLNQYGVHPFWPFYNGWVFGDLVFILEPWAWVTFSLFLISVTERKSLHRFYLGIVILGFALAFFSGTVPPPLSLALFVWALVLWGLFRFLQPLGRAVFHSFCVLGMLGSFFLASNRMALLSAKELNRDSNHTAIHDIILSPLPINPFCWSVLTVEKDNDFLRVRRALAAPFPSFLPLQVCQHLRFFAPLKSDTHSGQHFGWERTEEVPLLELRSLEAEFCDVREFLKFARAPYFWREDGELFVSDLRFERSGKRGFATIKVSPQRPPCPDSKAPWLSPIQSLLN